MKRFFTFITSLMLALSMTAQNGLDKTAMQIIDEMSPGINLGNTFEATTPWTGADFWNNKGGLGAETGWQGTKTTQAIIDYMRSLGFRSVRIPCAWAFGHISDASTYTIDAAWMARVKEVASGQKDMVLKDTAQQVAESKAQALRNNLLIALSAIVVLLLVIVWIRRKQSSQRE